MWACSENAESWLWPADFLIQKIWLGPRSLYFFFPAIPAVVSYRQSGLCKELNRSLPHGKPRTTPRGRCHWPHFMMSQGRPREVKVTQRPDSSSSGLAVKPTLSTSHSCISCSPSCTGTLGLQPIPSTSAISWFLPHEFKFLQGSEGPPC